LYPLTAPGPFSHSSRLQCLTQTRQRFSTIRQKTRISAAEISAIPLKLLTRRGIIGS
jgi:hypothetical protein